MKVKNMKAKIWIIIWLTMVVSLLFLMGKFVYDIDPYFHYRKPKTDSYYYILNNQRSQNDGICKHFEYDALITGTSMTENFKTSELDELFGVNSIKVSYSGGSYKEINDSIAIALKNNRDLKMVVRGLDTGMFFDSSNRMREDLGIYPTYLYDDNPFNDVSYLLNKDVIFGRAYAMTKENDTENFKPGITSFDNYSRWQSAYKFGIDTVLPNGISYSGNGKQIHLSDEEKKTICELISKNVTSLADKYPETEFYYFFTPYSIVWYKKLVENGEIYRQIEAEQYIIELILEHDNIKLFSFSGIEDIITNINHYKDDTHYGTWINSYILRCMRNNEHRLTKENYQKYLEEELKLFVNYDYNSLNSQNDYSNDFYAAALMNEAIWGVNPIDVIKNNNSIEIANAELIKGQYNNSEGIRCVGRLNREYNDNVSVEEYIKSTEYIGAKISIKDIGKHNYLVFYGKKISDDTHPTVIVIDNAGNKVGEVSADSHDLDKKWNQYIIDLSDVVGDITVYFNGGYTDNTGDVESEYIFSDIILY